MSFFVTFAVTMALLIFGCLLGACVGGIFGTIGAWLKLYYKKSVYRKTEYDKDVKYRCLQKRHNQVVSHNTGHIVDMEDDEPIEDDQFTVITDGVDEVTIKPNSNESGRDGE